MVYTLANCLFDPKYVVCLYSSQAAHPRKNDGSMNGGHTFKKVIQLLGDPAMTTTAAGKTARIQSTTMTARGLANPSNAARASANRG
eukprot:768575-Hanusia_phi.AAC.4